MKTYKIDHITDLLALPDDHFDEAIRDLRGVRLYTQLMCSALEAKGLDLPPLRDLLPQIEFTSDGLGEIRPSLNGAPLSVIKMKGSDS